jgi:hypothetical protein
VLDSVGDQSVDDQSHRGGAMTGSDPNDYRVPKADPLPIGIENAVIVDGGRLIWNLVHTKAFQ